MSRARPVYPQTVVFLTRRIHKRQLLLRPSQRVNQILAYIVAVLAARYRLRIHALCFLSNHWHLVATDDHGTIVEFERDCHALIARALNAMHGDFEGLWSREQSCRIRCVEPGDVLDKIAYTMANPVAAHLVAHGKNWPGLRFAWPQRPRTISRPPRFFRAEEDGGSWPEEVILELHRPPGDGDLSHEEMAAQLRQAIEEREATHRKDAASAGKPFLGRRDVLAQSRYAYATRCEKRFDIRPTVAAKSRWARIEKLQQSRAWRQQYAACRDRLRAGDTAVFPYGTWKLRVYYRIACEDPPDLAQLAA